MAQQVRVGVGCFIVRRISNKTQFLLGQRQDGLSPGTWGLPGGHLDFGETWEACARREVLEETGLDISAFQHVATSNDIFENSHYVEIIMAGEFDCRQTVKLMEPDKCQQWVWVSWDELQGQAVPLRDACTESKSAGTVRISPLFSSLDSMMSEFPHSTTLTVPFGDSKLAQIAKASLQVDNELSSDKVNRSISVEGANLIITFTATTLRMLRVQVVLDREDALARELLKKGDKRRALLALRRRKYQEQMILTTDSQLFNLQQLMDNVEFSLVQKDVLFGLEQGNKVLKQLNKEIRIEDVERLADDTAEAIAYQNEISELLQSNMSREDEEDVLRELDELERQESDRLKLNLPRVPDHQLPEPERPQTVDRVSGDEEDEEHRQPVLA
ncbi:Vacuolar protein sorting-associated protein 20 [Coemansia brasiliensis]|uniref:Vacuolar protein sorting-associated protein 20 n=1 Tax=Coemansia brasiliensis TaxID=2650707 RepID=A0A9W8IDK6_9FUNG|nr:Vacuolar protein sorting-associated protein 20 [Coemansia brasiliensis]